MSGLYLDAYSGLSGDMFLGALADLGVDAAELEAELHKLALEGWRLSAERVTSHGLSGTRLCVQTDDTPQPYRTLPDIRRLITSSGLSERVQARAMRVFELLATAEAKVHGTTPDEVHFHEVGAVDSIVDVVGACVALERLGVDGFACSPLPLGSGFVRTAHGLLPVPAPATAELLASCGAPVLPDKGEGELVTPTGAALVAAFGSFESGAPLVISRVGYGFGARELPWPNALRTFLTESAEPRDLETDEVTLLECNLDDMSPEHVPYVLERLLEEGALDAWWTPAGMKKSRPAVLLSALSPAGAEERLARLLLRETSTLGVRRSGWSRWKAARRVEHVDTEFGSIRVKLKLLGGEVAGAAPEYEDCSRAAREHGAPLREVYHAAETAARQVIDKESW